jgi:hypothetical protein
MSPDAALQRLTFRDRHVIGPVEGLPTSLASDFTPLIPRLAFELLSQLGWLFAGALTTHLNSCFRQACLDKYKPKRR